MVILAVYYVESTLFHYPTDINLMSLTANFDKNL